MIEENINKTGKKLKVLVGALDWGLGHATRCIPVIRALKELGHEVSFSGSGASLNLLKEEFPESEYYELPGYKIRLSHSKPGFIFKILRQLPSIFKTIKEEHKWLIDYSNSKKPDLIISDNRFGLYHTAIPSVYITHQLKIETGFSFLNRLAARIHAKFFNKFSRIWIPDFKELPGLAGKLSHPASVPQIPVSYLGPLSRMKKKETSSNETIVCLISGPEPQRTLFEKKLLEQVGQFKTAVIIIRGLPGSEKPIQISNPFIRIYNHLGSEELSHYLQSADKVICRSGYSTVMDLYTIRQFKALLVPTPGQSEQEYLGRHLDQIGMFSVVEQDALDIKKQVKKINAPQFSFTHYDYELKELLREELSKLCP